MNSIPQAFEIPLPKTGKTPPPVAKRLANTPRNVSPSSLEIKERLDNAAAKREERLKSAKLSAHIALVENRKNDFETRKREDAERLREVSKAKQDNAVAKRENQRLSWLQKITAATNHKLTRGKEVLEANQQKARELEASLDLKIANAELKREQLQIKNVEELKSANEEKIKRGKDALALAEAESRRLESKIENKIVDANSRKETKVQEIVDDISSKTEAKIVRGKIALSSQDQLSKQTLKQSWKKLDAANDRREGLVREQVELLRTVSTKKEERVIEKQLQDSDASRALRKTLAAKISAADLVRDELLRAKVKKAAADDLARLEKSKAVALKEVKLQKAMAEVVHDKMQSAEARKEMFLRDTVNKLSSSKKNLSPRDGTSSLTISDIESKIKFAADRREIYLAARSSSSKRVHSPRGCAKELTVGIIEEKLNSAAERREIYLKNKVSKNKKTSSESSPDNISKTLSFSSVSPSASPRIKAARLDARSKVMATDTFSPWLLSSFAVALLGMIAFTRFSKGE